MIIRIKPTEEAKKIMLLYRLNTLKEDVKDGKQEESRRVNG